MRDERFCNGMEILDILDIETIIILLIENRLKRKNTAGKELK